MGKVGTFASGRYKFFSSKINSPLLTAAPSQVEARDADDCGQGDDLMESGDRCDEPGRRGG